MPVTPEVMEIISILNEEGFGALAGELLTEISLGRESQTSGGAEDSVVEDVPLTSIDFRRFGWRTSFRQLYVDEGGGRSEQETVREPIPDNEQLRFASDFLKLRLVNPVRAWAEAEMIAGTLLFKQEAQEVPFKPIRIAFEQPASSREDSPQYAARNAEPGTTPYLNELVEVLSQIANSDS